MLELEEQVTAMGPLIDAALEKVDRRHAQLTQLSSDLVDALNLYHTLMREPPPPTPSNYTLPKMSPHINPYQFKIRDHRHHHNIYITECLRPINLFLLEVVHPDRIILIFQLVNIWGLRVCQT